MLHDLRFAFRQLFLSPGFTFVALLTLALGIGASTAIFSVVDGVLLRPLAYPESERLVVIRETKLPQFPEFSVAPGQYFTWLEQAHSFASLAAYRGGSYNLTGGNEPQRLSARRVTANYLATLRVHPALGRDFLPEEDAEGQSHVVLLTDGFWQRQFGGRPEALGAKLILDGSPYTVVGILPRSFQPGSTADLFTPAAFTAQERENHGGHYIGVIGRLQDGVTVAQARSELEAIAARLAQQFPDSNAGWGVKLAPMLEYAVADVRPMLYALLGAVGFLLLIGCANVANLLLARATSRAREISIRVALGAGRARIVRQLLTESVLLGLGGALLGLLVADWSMSALLALAPDSLPRAQELGLDGRALGFAMILALATGVGFGLAPALQAARTDVHDALKESARGSSESRLRRRLRGALVAGEIAIALVLLVGAGLLIRSFTRLQDVDPGFQARDAWTVGLSLPDAKYPDDAAQARFVDEATRRVAAIPGVGVTGASNVVPFTGNDYILGFDIQGHPPAKPGEEISTNYYAITPDYFRAMGVPLIRGRFFDDRDRAGANRVAIINESMAKRFFGGADPIGQHINVTNGPETWREIVGVVGDVKHYALDQATPLQTYEPIAQKPSNVFTFVVRTSGPVAGLPASIRTAIHAVDPDQPVARVAPLTQLLADSIARRRFAMLLFVVFSGVALVLASVGIYGVMSYAATRRRGEIGIRMALGAQRADVLRLILGQGSRLIAAGLVAGLAGALLLTRFLGSMLFDVGRHDPLTFAAIAALLAAVALLACLVPAFRATRVDPLIALRSE